MSSIFSDPPFRRGATLAAGDFTYGGSTSGADILGGEIVGQIKAFQDVDPYTGQRYSNRLVYCQAVRYKGADVSDGSTVAGFLYTIDTAQENGKPFCTITNKTDWTLTSSTFTQAAGTGTPNTLGQATVTLAAANANIAVGQFVYGTNVPTGATVAAISGTTLTLSIVTTTAISASTVLTFVGPSVPTDGEREIGVLDEYLTGNLKQNDVVWLVVKGPAKVRQTAAAIGVGKLVAPSGSAGRIAAIQSGLVPDISRMIGTQIDSAATAATQDLLPRINLYNEKI